MAKKKLFMHSAKLDEFPYPPSCPFNTSRAGGTRKLLESLGLLVGGDKVEVAPEPVDRALLEKFHTADYLDVLQEANRGEHSMSMLSMGLGTADCPVFAGVYDYSVLGTGATVGGAKQIIEGKADVAFNPSGGYHHAHADAAAGFCYINDNALGLMTFADAGLRAIYLDVDVHHGDGVQEAFYYRDDVMTISLHQSGRTLFPGTGFEDEIGQRKGKGYAVNVPLPPGTYDELYLKAVREIVLPLVESYKPDVFVIEIGADALAGDPLASLSLTNNVYADVIGMIHKFSKPILATGGGGYHIENTVRAWALAWCALCKEEPGRDMTMGMGGVMLESADWQGGLRDRAFVPDERQREIVAPQVDSVIERVKNNVFSLHGI